MARQGRTQGPPFSCIMHTPVPSAQGACTLHWNLILFYLILSPNKLPQTLLFYTQIQPDARLCCFCRAVFHKKEERIATTHSSFAAKHCLFPFVSNGPRLFMGWMPGPAALASQAKPAYLTSGRLAAALLWPTRRVISSGASGRNFTLEYSSSITRPAVSRMISPPLPLITRPIICTWWMS